MATQTICYTSTVKLPCLDELPHPVILCLCDPGILNPAFCPEYAEYYYQESYEYQTLEVELVNYSVDENCIYTYLFEYDSGYLNELLTPGGIEHVECKSCFHDWVEASAGQEITLIQDEETGEVTFTSQHGCEFQFTAAVGGEEFYPGHTLYGDGSDGDLTVLNGQQHIEPYPARTMFYENLTIDAGGVFYPAGVTSQGFSGDWHSTFPIIVQDTLTISGEINLDGAGATPGPPATTGAFEGSGGMSGYTGFGGNGQTGAPPPGNGSYDDLLSGPQGWAVMGGGFGGNGGDAGAGGTGGISNNPLGNVPAVIGQLYLDFAPSYPPNDVALSCYYQEGIGGGGGGAGGGGGSRTGASLGGAGGDGGIGGGCILIFARNVVLTSTGRLSVRGSDGFAGSNASGASAAAGGGGGGGGGGGLIYIVCDTLTSEGTVDLSPGAGALGGSGVAGGANGQPGLDGEPGHLYIMTRVTGLFQVV